MGRSSTAQGWAALRRAVELVALEAGGAAASGRRCPERRRRTGAAGIPGVVAGRREARGQWGSGAIGWRQPGVGTAATARPRPAIIIALRRSILGIANTVIAKRPTAEKKAQSRHPRCGPEVPFTHRAGKSPKTRIRPYFPAPQLTGKHTATNGIGGQICTGGMPGGSTDGGGGAGAGGGPASQPAGAGAATHMFDGASYTVPGPHSAALPTAGATTAAPAKATAAAGAVAAALRTLTFTDRTPRPRGRPSPWRRRAR